MTLYQSTYILSFILALVGLMFLFKPDAMQGYVSKFLRSKLSAIFTFGTGGLWFLWILSNLGEADFGNIKGILIAIFGIGGLLAFFFLDDFLSVRGLAILGLLSSREFIDSAFMQEPTSRLVLVSISYAIVIASIYLGAVPYRLRDFFEYLYLSKLRVRAFGILLCALSLSLDIASIFY